MRSILPVTVALLAGATVVPGPPAASARDADVAPVTPESAHGARTVQPGRGDWEGSGPHGLQMSFELVPHGRSERLRYLAVSLPSGCRIGPSPSFYATYFATSYYYPPTPYPEPILRSAFEVKPAGDFAIVGIDRQHPQFPLVVIGSFGTSRTGTAAVPAYPFKCAKGGWPRTLHFALRTGRRTAVSDGTYTGSVAGPPAGITGTVRATVAGGGRVLTDLALSWSCPDASGGFELGPTVATGEFVGSDGAIDGHWTPLGTWSGRFAPGGKLAGTFTNLASGDCTQGQSTAFTAMLTTS